MTIEQARDIVRQADPSEQDLHTAEIVLTLSDYYGDNMVAFELRRARFIKKVMK